MSVSWRVPEIALVIFDIYIYNIYIYLQFGEVILVFRYWVVDISRAALR